MARNANQDWPVGEAVPIPRTARPVSSRRRLSGAGATIAHCDVPQRAGPDGAVHPSKMGRSTAATSGCGITRDFLDGLVLQGGG